MKIVVLFGTDTDRVQTRMLDILKGVKKKGFRVSEINGKTSFSEAFNAASLFEENILFVSEVAAKRVETDWSWIAKNADQQSVSLLLLFGDTVPAKIKKHLPKDTKYEEFKIPVIIFQFLDSLVPGNKNSLTLLKKVTNTEPIELVFSMMVTHFRDMYWVLVDSASYAGADWKKGKLMSQAQKNGLTKLEDAFAQLVQIDLDVKSSVGSLSILVDTFLISFLVLK